MHVCVLFRLVMGGTWRVVSTSVCVALEVRSSVAKAAVSQPLRSASYKMENMNVSH